VNIKRTGARRGRSAATSVRLYLSDVIDVASQVNSPTFDQIAMSASDFLTRLDAIDGPTAGLIEAMGGPAVTATFTESPADAVALGVLRRSHDALVLLGEDCEAPTIRSGLAACGRIIKHLQHTTRGEVNLTLLAGAALAPKSRRVFPDDGQAQ
jgi:hypothetical protein